MTLRICLVSLSLIVAMMVGCMQTQENEVYFSFTHKGLSSDNTEGFYVRGHLSDKTFVAESEVLGDGEFGKSGQPGWIELSDGKYYPMHTARAPRSPYVKGFMTQSGFKPQSREVL